jgi:hypothetical protein
MIGGLGSGKTRTGAEAFVDLVLANPGCDLLMAGPTHEMTRDIVIPAFEHAMPAQMILRYRKSEKRYILRGGRTVKHASADKPQSLEGQNLAGWWSDEARYWRPASYRNLLARGRAKKARRVQGIVTTTPAMNWLADEFNTDKPGRAVYRASTRENEHNLAPGYIDDLKRSYSPRLVESLVDGRFTVVEGQVYEDFDEGKHLIHWVFDPALRSGLALDFGVACPSVLFWQQLDVPRFVGGVGMLPAGSLVIYDELQVDNTPTARLVPLIAQKLGMTRAKGASRYTGGRRLDAIWCDKAGGARDQATGIASKHLLKVAFGEGLVQSPTSPEQTWIPNGVALVQGLLAPADGTRPRLYVARALKDGPARGIVRSFRGYTYPERKGNRPPSDIPVHDPVHSHAMDATRYLVVGLHQEESESTGAGVPLSWGG